MSILSIYPGAVNYPKISATWHAQKSVCKKKVIHVHSEKVKIDKKGEKLEKSVKI